MVTHKIPFMDTCLWKKIAIQIAQYCFMFWGYIFSIIRCAGFLLVDMQQLC